MNAAQVRSKARTAMKRREEEVEQEEIEGGEINLIPYLDIVTNLMLFLLASITAGLILGQLNTTLPDQGPTQAAMADNQPEKSPDDQPLKLVVSVTKEQIILWSITGLEGTLEQPAARIPRVADVGTEKPIPAFNYKQLNDTLVDIAKRRWLGKKRTLPTFQAILQADGDIPYGTIIAIMDAMRCKLPAPNEPAQACLFPSEDPAIKQMAEPVDTLSGLYDLERVSYNPEEHALFHDILFSSGFE